MKPVTRTYSPFIILLTFILCIGSCVQDKRKPDVIRVSVLRGPSVIALAKWINAPPQPDGRKFEITISDSPDMVLASIIKKETDIAVLPMISAANLYNKGIDYTLAGCPVWGTLYIVGKEPVTTLHVFGSATTPDILTRHYLKEKGYEPQLNYAFPSPSEVTQAILAGRIEAAVLSEPYISLVLRNDTSLHILANLNNPDGTGMGFAQTAIMLNPSLKGLQAEIDKLIAESCIYATTHPEKAISILEEAGIFKEGMLTEESIRRNKIHYLPAKESEDEIYSFLKVIESYEPKAIGGKLPDRGFIYGKP